MVHEQKIKIGLIGLDTSHVTAFTSIRCKSFLRQRKRPNPATQFCRNRWMVGCTGNCSSASLHTPSRCSWINRLP